MCYAAWSGAERSSPFGNPSLLYSNANAAFLSRARGLFAVKTSYWDLDSGMPPAVLCSSEMSRNDTRVSPARGERNGEPYVDQLRNKLSCVHFGTTNVQSEDCREGSRETARMDMLCRSPLFYALSRHLLFTRPLVLSARYARPASFPTFPASLTSYPGRGSAYHGACSVISANRHQTKSAMHEDL